MMYTIIRNIVFLILLSSQPVNLSNTMFCFICENCETVRSSDLKPCEPGNGADRSLFHDKPQDSNKDINWPYDAGPKFLQESSTQRRKGKADEDAALYDDDLDLDVQDCEDVDENQIGGENQNQLKLKSNSDARPKTKEESNRIFNDQDLDSNVQHYDEDYKNQNFVQRKKLGLKSRNRLKFKDTYYERQKRKEEKDQAFYDNKLDLKMQDYDMHRNKLGGVNRKRVRFKTSSDGRQESKDDLDIALFDKSHGSNVKGKRKAHRKHKMANRHKMGGVDRHRLKLRTNFNDSRINQGYLDEVLHKKKLNSNVEDYEEDYEKDYEEDDENKRLTSDGSRSSKMDSIKTIDNDRKRSGIERTKESSVKRPVSSKKITSKKDTARTLYKKNDRNERITSVGSQSSKEDALKTRDNDRTRSGANRAKESTVKRPVSSEKITRKDDTDRTLYKKDDGNVIRRSQSSKEDALKTCDDRTRSGTTTDKESTVKRPVSSEKITDEDDIDCEPVTVIVICNEEAELEPCVTDLPESLMGKKDLQSKFEEPTAYIFHDDTELLSLQNDLAKLKVICDNLNLIIEGATRIRFRTTPSQMDPHREDQATVFYEVDEDGQKQKKLNRKRKIEESEMENRHKWPEIYDLQERFISDKSKQLRIKGPTKRLKYKKRRKTTPRFTIQKNASSTTQSTFTNNPKTSIKDEDAEDQLEIRTSLTSAKEDSHDQPATGMILPPAKEDSDDQPETGMSLTPAKEDSHDQPATGMILTPAKEDSDDQPKTGMSLTPAKEDSDDQPEAGMSLTPAKEDSDDQPEAGMSLTPAKEDSDHQPETGISSTPASEGSTNQAEIRTSSTPANEDSDDQPENETSWITSNADSDEHPENETNWTPANEDSDDQPENGTNWVPANEDSDHQPETGMGWTPFYEVDYGDQQSETIVENSNKFFIRKTTQNFTTDFQKEKNWKNLGLIIKEMITTYLKTFMKPRGTPKQNYLKPEAIQHHHPQHGSTQTPLFLKSQIGTGPEKFNLLLNKKLKWNKWDRDRVHASPLMKAVLRPMKFSPLTHTDPFQIKRINTKLTRKLMKKPTRKWTKKPMRKLTRKPPWEPPWEPPWKPPWKSALNSPWNSPWKPTQKVKTTLVPRLFKPMALTQPFRRFPRKIGDSLSTINVHTVTKNSFTTRAYKKEGETLSVRRQILSPNCITSSFSYHGKSIETTSISEPSVRTTTTASIHYSALHKPSLDMRRRALPGFTKSTLASTASTARPTPVYQISPKVSTFNPLSSSSSESGASNLNTTTSLKRTRQRPRPLVKSRIASHSELFNLSMHFPAVLGNSSIPSDKQKGSPSEVAEIMVPRKRRTRELKSSKSETLLKPVRNPLLLDTQIQQTETIRNKFPGRMAVKPRIRKRYAALANLSQPSHIKPQLLPVPPLSSTTFRASSTTKSTFNHYTASLISLAMTRSPRCFIIIRDPKIAAIAFKKHFGGGSSFAPSKTKATIYQTYRINVRPKIVPPLNDQTSPHKHNSSTVESSTQTTGWRIPKRVFTVSVNSPTWTKFRGKHADPPNNPFISKVNSRLTQNITILVPIDIIVFKSEAAKRLTKKATQNTDQTGQRIRRSTTLMENKRTVSVWKTYHYSRTYTPPRKVTMNALNEPVKPIPLSLNDLSFNMEVLRKPNRFPRELLPTSDFACYRINSDEGIRRGCIPSSDSNPCQTLESQYAATECNVCYTPGCNKMSSRTLSISCLFLIILTFIF